MSVLFVDFAFEDYVFASLEVRATWAFGRFLYVVNEVVLSEIPMPSKHIDIQYRFVRHSIPLFQAPGKMVLNVDVLRAIMKV